MPDFVLQAIQTLLIDFQTALQLKQGVAPQKTAEHQMRETFI